MAESKRTPGEACRDTRATDGNDGLRLRRSQRNAIEQPQMATQGSTEGHFHIGLL